MTKSEFGKGLVVCLVKFAEHIMDMRFFLDMYEKMRKQSSNPELFTESTAIELWASGASDHLYEIEVPKGEDWNEIRGKVHELRDKGLVMRNGFDSKNVWTQADATKLGELAREIAFMIDRKLGLKPEMGEC